MKLKDKVAVVTGGSQGIGEAIACRFGAEGAHVAVVYSRNDVAAAHVVKTITQAGGVAATFKGDCAQVADIERMTSEIADRFGAIDILVNNAGVFLTTPILETTEAIWDEQLDLNLKGLFFFSKAVIPHFRKRGGGKIINLSSIAGVGAFPNCAAYCAAKGGVVNLTKALAAELAHEHINVNSIAPGNVATPINAHLRGAGHEAYERLMSERTPTRRSFMDAQDMAGAAVFLASDDAKGVHGAILMVDDGWAA
jgi:NAD(P)-dependent dehydrogenase (short-subunit alcohol dehydrogenase family)